VIGKDPIYDEETCLLRPGVFIDLLIRINLPWSSNGQLGSSAQTLLS